MATMNYENEFYCTLCGEKLKYPIPRISGKHRPVGHLKKIWCDKCGKETNHVECRPYTKYSYSDFLLEFNYNNFTQDGNRIMKYGLFRNKIHNEGVDLYQYEE